MKVCLKLEDGGENRGKNLKTRGNYGLKLLDEGKYGIKLEDEAKIWG